jgi:tripartite-type tricarboxylate transporter receptor subunit TctC
MKTVLSIVIAAIVLAAGGVHAQIQRPVRMLAPSPPGGPSDVQARLVAPTMSTVLGQPVVIDNRASNNGVVSAELCSKAVPDGYTVCVGNSGTHAVNATLYKQLPYDVLADFAPVSMFGTTGMVIAAWPKLPGTHIRDFAAYAKANPGKVNIAIPGATGELAGDELWTRLQVQVNNVGYKGSAPAQLAIVTGESHISLLTPLAVATFVADGRIKAYGITSAQRNPMLPNVPTIAEQGVTGYGFDYWNGLFAPKKIPDATLRQLHKAVMAALDAPEVRDRFTQLGLTIIRTTPEEFAEIVKTDLEKFRKVIIESGIPRL